MVRAAKMLQAAELDAARPTYKVCITCRHARQFRNFMPTNGICDVVILQKVHIPLDTRSGTIYTD
jgi:hypothetical protein